MATADVNFIRNLEPNPVTVEFPTLVYAYEASVRDKIFNEIKLSGQPEGHACVEDVCFEWRVAKLDDEMKELVGPECETTSISRRVVVVKTLETASS